MATYEEIFGNNTEETLVNAVRNGMNVYLRNYSSEYNYETFFEAAVKYGTPALVNACIDMGADVNCVAPIKARNTDRRSKTSSLVAAMRAYNPRTLRALFERGARTGVLNNLFWVIQRNILPEAANGENANAKKIKQRLDNGAEILKILRNAGFRVPGLDRDDDKMSFYQIYPLDSGCSYSKEEEEIAGEKYTAWEDWDEKYADGGDDDEEKFDRYCENVMEWMSECSFPSLGTRPGALWHAASPEALKLMIESGADVNARDAAGWTALHHIAVQCYSDYYFNPNAMLQVLMDSGADINVRGRYGLTPLMLAAVNVRKHPKALETVKFLLKSGADFDARDENNNGVWYWMRDFFYGDEKLILQEILFEMYSSTQPDKAGADDNETDVINPVPMPAVDLDLMTAAFWGTAEDLAPILARGANLEARSKHGYTPLMFASVWNHAPAAEFLVEHGANLNAKNVRGEFPLILAIQTMDFPMIWALFDAGTNLKEADKWGQTPLITLVSFFCSKYLAQDFIDAGADVNAKDKDGRTALMRVAEYSSPSIDVARVLVNAGADVNERDNNGQTALEIALNEAGEWSKPGEFIKFLIANGADPKLMSLENPKETGKDEHLANCLQKLGLKPGRRFRDVFAGNTMEDIANAVRNGLDLSLKDADKEVFLNAALRHGAPEVVQACVDRGINVNERWSGGGMMTFKTYPEAWPLSTAIEARNADAVEVLLKAGADPEIADKLDWHERTNVFPERDGKSKDAKEFKRRLDAGAKILRILREAGARVPNSHDAEITYSGVGYKECDGYKLGETNTVVQDILIETGESANETGGAIEKLLQDAGIDVSKKGFRAYIDAGCNVHTLTKATVELLMNERGIDASPVKDGIEKILRAAGGCKEPGDSGSLPAVTALRRAVSPDALKLLIDAGVDVNARGPGGCTAMHWVARDWSEYFDPDAMLKVLLNAGANVNTRDDDGVTPLMLLAGNAAKHPSAMEAVKRLTAAGADFKAKDLKRRSVYKWMEKNHSGSTLEKLLRRKILNIIRKAFEPENQKKTESVREKADADLLTAACWGNVTEIEAALSRGVSVNTRSGSRYTPLMFASVFNTKEAVQFLLEKGAKVDARNKRKETALILASLSGRSDPDIARALIEAGADIDVKNNNGDTLLKQAMEQSRFKTVKVLLAAGADPKGIFDDKREEEDDDDIGGADDEESDESDFAVCLRQFGLKY